MASRAARPLQHLPRGAPYRQPRYSTHRPPDTQAHSTRLARARHTRAQTHTSPNTCPPAPPRELGGRHPPASPPPDNSRPGQGGGPESEFQRVCLQGEGEGTALGPGCWEIRPAAPPRDARPHRRDPARRACVPSSSLCKPEHPHDEVSHAFPPHTRLRVLTNAFALACHHACLHMPHAPVG